MNRICVKVTRTVVAELQGAVAGPSEVSVARSWACCLVALADVSISAVGEAMPANMLCEHVHEEWC